MRDQRKGIQSVEQGAKLLEALIKSRKPLPLKTLASLAEMSASMAHRYLTSFIRTELVQQDPVSGHYDLGTLALRLGLAALNRSDYMQVAEYEFRQLVERVDIDGHISVWGTYGVTMVRYHNRHAPILSNFRLGDVLSLLDSAAGRIFLTYLSDPTTRPILNAEISKSEDNKPSAEDIKNITQFVRKEGYAWIDGQVFHSIRAIAAPIFDSQGDLQATISLVSNQASLVQFPNPVLDDLKKTAERISYRLGWSATPAP
ncbi:MAG: IclR family transcriptional regulator [Pseudorhodoplanes sp.]|jgi:DNA-binding IclR family transcriptional regulator|nr:IclR family transcriptional regulator [Pseudorhodoplanes sp.]